MAEEIKFTEEELSELKNLQDSFNGAVLQFGQLNIEELNLTRASERLTEARKKLNNSYEELLKKERELAEKLNAKYGPGVLDPKTGIFTPQPTQETA